MRRASTVYGFPFLAPTPFEANCSFKYPTSLPAGTSSGNAFAQAPICFHGCTRKLSGTGQAGGNGGVGGEAIAGGNGGVGGENIAGRELVA